MNAASRYHRPLVGKDPNAPGPNPEWLEHQRRAAEAEQARIDAMTPQELDAHYRSERARQALLDAGVDR